MQTWGIKDMDKGKTTACSQQADAREMAFIIGEQALPSLGCLNLVASTNGWRRIGDTLREQIQAGLKKSPNLAS